MKSRKQQAAQFGIDPKDAAQIQPVGNHPVMIEINAEMTSLKEKLETVKEKIRLHFEQPTEGSAPRGNPELDGLALREGKPLEELTGPPPSQMNSLRRQEKALKQAIETCTTDRQCLETRIIHDECRGELSPIIRKYHLATIEAMKALRVSLEKQEGLNHFLATKGYTANLRPIECQTSPAEVSLLYGGGAHGHLSGVIKNREEVWQAAEKWKARKTA